MHWTLLLGLLTVFPTAFQTVDDTTTFRDGRYLIDFTAEDMADYEIEIIGNAFIAGKPDSTIKGKIIQLGPELYIFRNDENPPNEATSEIGRLIDKSFGEQCIEVGKVRGNRIFFRTTYAGNLHITVNEGVFIRKKLK